MPDKQLDLLMKMIIQNKDKLAPIKRKKFFNSLTNAEVKKIETIIKQRNHAVWPD